MANNGNGDYGALVLEAATQHVLGGNIKLEAGDNAVNNALEALEKQTKALADAEYSTEKPEITARAAAHTGKVIDEVARLMSFARGGPDSREALEVGESKAVQQFLRVLSDEQFSQLCQWIEQSKQREAESEDSERTGQ